MQFILDVQAKHEAWLQKHEEAVRKHDEQFAKLEASVATLSDFAGRFDISMRAGPCVEAREGAKHAARDTGP